MTEKCQRCRQDGDDRRTLWMACFYQMDELGIPLEKETLFTTDYPRCDGKDFYTLRVCKDCRADWMKSIKDWFNSPLVMRDSCGSGIFVRENGAIREVTEEEFKKTHPGIQPVRFIHDSE